MDERTRLFLFHKPRGLVTTYADTHGRPTIFGALPKDIPRVVSIGRLDLTSEGLLLLTNDGALARAMELPERGWVRRGRAVVADEDGVRFSPRGFGDDCRERQIIDVAVDQ